MHIVERFQTKKRRVVACRLLCNLQVDASKARMLLGRQPLVAMDEQLAKMFEHKG